VQMLPATLNEHVATLLVNVLGRVSVGTTLSA